ncbi:cytoplasmic dynein 2 intermediate chain 2-like [Watersipora subatra]|uniref:cytoplasmic dynein 2 intermediate chain 2-like n=1 Tax=Watersipora subatra TaxID=2589382 RepID=UPI00355B27F0
MFADEIVGEVVFNSSWRKERDSSSTSTQTRLLKTSDVAAQSFKRRNAEAQTDTDTKSYQLIEEDDSDALLQFLKQVEPMISKALNRNTQSTAFDGYVSAAELESGKCSVVHTLCNEEHNGLLSVTSLSWNSTGSVVAASFGRFDHEDWCVHKASLCSWNVNKSVVTGNKPDTIIDTASCLLTVAFHPVKPALIAGGSFNGEVMVWDYSRDTDMLVATSGKGDESHNEPISKVLWQRAPGKRVRYNVLSVGMDGKILIWKLDADKHKLVLTQSFVLLAKHMPRSVKIKSSKKHQEMGVTSLSFSSIDEDVFYMGAESGGMFKCSFATDTDIGDGSQSTPLVDPVKFTFSPHHGPVYSMAGSPHHRNLLLSCSSDTTLRLHSVLQTQPLVVIEPACGYLYAARWSPIRPLVLAVTTQDGQLLIYDLRKSETTPVESLDASPTKQSIYTMEFNSKQRHLMASGDALGVIKVWRLNDELTVESAAERELLNKLADVSSHE